VGSSSLLIVTSSVELAHTPLAIVHRSVTLLPAATPVMVDEGEEGVVMVAEPLTIDQDPVPTLGALAAMVNVEVLHKV
jgi:hypothetical protein